MADLSSETLKNDIKDILKDADLSTLSGKKVRKQLEEKYEIDLSSRKKEVDELVMKTLDEVQNTASDSEPEVKQEESSESEGLEDDQPPPLKKKKKEGSSGDKVDDEELAKQLHEEMNSDRRTRGGRTPHVKASKKKEKDPANKKPPKDCYLSPKLAAIVGSEKMPRSQVVKRMWEIIKERNLQDPKQRNFMICDEELYTVFGRKRVKTFGMMKYLSQHIFRNENEFDKSTC